MWADIIEHINKQFDPTVIGPNKYYRSVPVRLPSSSSHADSKMNNNT